MEGKLQALCDKFNEKYPIGTKGILLKGSIKSPVPVDTKVTIKAHVTGDSAVAFFEGVRGCYEINRFRAAN